MIYRGRYENKAYHVDVLDFVSGAEISKTSLHVAHDEGDTFFDEMKSPQTLWLNIENMIAMESTLRSTTGNILVAEATLRLDIGNVLAAKPPLRSNMRARLRQMLRFCLRCDIEIEYKRAFCPFFDNML